MTNIKTTLPPTEHALTDTADATVTDHLREAGQAGENVRDALATVSPELGHAAVQATVDTVYTDVSGTRRLGNNFYEGGQAMAKQAGSSIARGASCAGRQLQIAGQKTGRAAGWTKTQAGQAAAWTGQGAASLGRGTVRLARPLGRAGVTAASLGLEALAVFMVSRGTMRATCNLADTPQDPPGAPHDTLLLLIGGLGLWGVLTRSKAVPAGMSRASAVAAMAATQLGVAVYSIGHLLPSPEVKMAGMVTGLVGIVAQLVYRAQTFTRTLDGVGVGRLALQGVALGVFICSSREAGLRGFDGNLEDGRRGILVAAGITLLAVTAALWPPAVKTRALPAADTAGAFSA